MRAFITLLVVHLAVAVLVAPLAAEAQPAAKVARIGFLSQLSPSDPGAPARLRAFQQGLRELGYLEGRNLVIESRWAEGKWDRLPGLAAELVRLKVDVIVTAAPVAIQAAKQATATIPIVMAGVIDPVATGFVATLAHPGGNITGLSLMTLELLGKQLEILREIVPNISRVAVLSNPASAGTGPQLRHAQDSARALGMRLLMLEARGPGEIEGAFAAMTRERAGAVIVLLDGMFIEHRARIADVAARNRLPAMYAMRDHVEAGGLITYATNILERYGRAATFVDKILRGVRPGDLPVEQPTTFELVINLRTAKALGLAIPQSLLLRADQVID